MAGNRYNFYLDGILFENPGGWRSWNGILDRDSDKGGILNIEEGALTFTGDTYQYLYNKRLEGYCSYVDVFIEESCSRNGDFLPAFKGLIFLSDVDFDITECSAACNLVDNNFSAKINNNRGIEVNVNAGKTKNGEDIDLVTLWTIAMFNPCDGSPSPIGNARAYRAYDVAAYLINFMTDGTVEFRSTALDIGGKWEGVFLTKGLFLNNPLTSDISIKMKWEDFIRNISRACDLSWKIDSTGTKPVFVLEETDSLFENTTLFTLNNVKKIIRSIDTSRNYASVDLGTDDIIESTGCGNVLGDLAFPDQIELLGCKKEQFAVTGTCNLDTSLDLTLDWIVSSNVIENIHIFSDIGYQDSVILLHCENLNAVFPDTAEAIQGDVFGTTPPVYYNTAFYNYEIAKRHFRAIPSTLVKYLNRPETGFKAQTNWLETITFPASVVTGATARKFPWPFGDDFTAPNFDTNNDYGNGTTPGVTISDANSYYTAPFQNVYKFKVGMSLTVLTAQIITIVFKRYDSGLVFIADYQVPTKNYTSGTFTNEQFESPLIFMNAGDVIAVQIDWEGTAGGPSDPVTFELIATGQQGGTFQIYNPQDYIADLVKVRSPLNMAQWYQMKLNPTQKITVDDGKNTVSGWIKTAKHSRDLLMADITLLTTNGN